MTLAFVAMFLAQFDRKRFQKAEGDFGTRPDRKHRPSNFPDVAGRTHMLPCRFSDPANRRVSSGHNAECRHRGGRAPQAEGRPQTTAYPRIVLPERIWLRAIHCE